MPVEPFDVTDEKGVRVTGTAEAYRDPHGAFYNPKSPFYRKPRFSDDPLIDYLNTRDVCRINSEVLSQAVQEAFSNALIRLGIPGPSKEVVEKKIGDSIAETLRQCALHPDKYVSDPSSPSALMAGRSVGDPAGYVQNADNSARDELPIRRLTRVRPTAVVESL